MYYSKLNMISLSHKIDNESIINSPLINQFLMSESPSKN